MDCLSTILRAIERLQSIDPQASDCQLHIMQQGSIASGPGRQTGKASGVSTLFVDSPRRICQGTTEIT